MVIVESGCFWNISDRRHKMKYDLSDLTVLMPVRIESLVRLENVLAVLGYLERYFKINVMVWEADQKNNGILQRQISDRVNYSYVYDCDPVFYRTSYINRMANDASTDFLAVWDADVVCSPRQVNEAILKLRSGVLDFCYPYDGEFLDTGKLIREEFLENGDINVLDEFHGFMSAPYGPRMRGGAFLVNAQKYSETGMENLNFYGWGPEDWERYERWKNLGYRVGDVKGCLYHLSHPRDMNGTHNSSQQKMYSHYERLQTMYSSANEIVKRMNLNDEGME